MHRRDLLLTAAAGLATLAVPSVALANDVNELGAIPARGRLVRVFRIGLAETDRSWRLTPGVLAEMSNEFEARWWASFPPEPGFRYEVPMPNFWMNAIESTDVIRNRSSGPGVEMATCAALYRMGRFGSMADTLEQGLWVSKHVEPGFVVVEWGWEPSIREDRSWLETFTTLSVECDKVREKGLWSPP